MADVYNVMIDLETMGTRPESAICSIGAVKFDIDRGIYDEYHQSINLKSCEKVGMVFNADTLTWWLKQDEKAYNFWIDSKNNIRDVLISFGKWLGPNAFVWGNGAMFDLTILENAYQRFGLWVPWKYPHALCYRTVAKIFPFIEYKHNGTQHLAIDDARSQALHLIEILKVMRQVHKNINFINQQCG